MDQIIEPVAQGFLKEGILGLIIGLLLWQNWLQRGDAKEAEKRYDALIEKKDAALLELQRERIKEMSTIISLAQKVEGTLAALINQAHRSES